MAPVPRPSSSEKVLGIDPKALLARVIPGLGATGDAAGERVGDYELREQIAEGGMGVVYRARQLSLQRTVALKMIRSGLLATRHEVERFRSEAEAAASLDHPNIVPIYEIGEAGGRHYFSMKLIEGGNLAELSAECDATRRQGVEWSRRAAEIVAKMARAVHHAHQRGLLHRDVKPTNVLLDPNGEPHLGDFGLAKLLERDNGLTQTIAVMGTPSYMAPEQAAGNATQLTVAADIYSLGAVLYELLAGHPPFEGGTTLELLRSVQEREPAALRTANPALSRDLETICLKCLQKEPPRRYATAEDLAADLERWLEGKPIQARAVGPLEKFGLWTRRNPVAAFAGVLLLVLAAVATAAAVRLRGQRDEINETLRNSYLAQAQVQRLSTVAGRRTESLRILAEAARIRPSLEVRNEVIAALALPELSPPQTWHAARPQLNTHQRLLTADGERFALFGQLKNITVHRRADGEVLAELTTPPNHLFFARFSPDGRYLISRDQANNVFVWDLARSGRGPHPHSYTLPGPWEYFSDFTPDSRSLALAAQDKRVRFFDLENGMERRQIELPFVARRLALSPAGDQLAISTGGSLFVWGIDPARQIRSHKHSSNITVLTWHPQGRLVAVGYENGEVQLFDSLSGASRWLTSHQQFVSSLAFDPQGTLIASSSFDSTHRYSEPATGRVLFETKDTGELQATRDGRYFAAAYDSGSIGAREVLRSGVFRTLTSAHEGYSALFGVDISPDNRWLVSGDKNGMHVWAINDGREVALAASTSATHPRFHPNGKFIVTGGKGVLLRWPVLPPEDGGAMLLGPPEVLVSVPDDYYGEVDFTPDGEWVAVARPRGSLVLKWSDPAQRVVLSESPGSTGERRLVLSRDAQWVACATSHGAGVWNARDGSLLQSLMEYSDARLALSPDDRTLATATARELVLWDTTKWEPKRRIRSGLTDGVPVPVAFSPDGSLLAVAASRQEIELLDARTGDPIARLTPPLPVNLVTLRFSPDGRHLAAQTLGPAIHVWDLDALRGELRTLGLDW